MDCPQCKGHGKVTCTVHTFGEKTTSIKLPCPTCNGKGQATPAEKAAHQEFLDSWCKCGAKNGNEFHDDTPTAKHHYTCIDCGKVTQVG